MILLAWRALAGKCQECHDNISGGLRGSDPCTGHPFLKLIAYCHAELTLIVKRENEMSIPLRLSGRKGHSFTPTGQTMGLLPARHERSIWNGSFRAVPSISRDILVKTLKD